jgi:uncharacterized membrane protein YeiH
LTPFHVVQLLATAVFASSGAIAAGRKRMDVIGVVVIAIVTAIGGGTIRDVLLDRYPVFWIADPSYLVVPVIAAGLTLLYVAFRRPPDNALAIADALGLAMTAILGAQIAEEKGVGGVVVVLMGAITGVAGGAIRDVLSAEVPLILRKSELYASAAIAGLVLYLALRWLGVPRIASGAAGMATIAALRIAAIVFGLKLPVLPVREE